MKSLRAKIVWASTSIMVVAVLVLLVISQINLSKTGKMALQRYDDAVDEGYNKEIKSEVQTAMTVMQNFYDQAQAGTYTEEEAKNLAKETIRSMRYGDEGDG